jgi:Retrotransposon gag protein
MSDQNPSLPQQIINSNNALNRKVDNLAETLGNLTLGDDLKEYVTKQLASIKREGGLKELKIKDLDTFDGTRQKLRSWLTAANNQIYNKGVEGEERKVRFIGSYLRGGAWNWFEPILREADEEPRNEWDDRTARIMSSYKEFKRGLGQVFGEIDERKTAAEKLQRLHQTKSVTAYITEFQTITSNLEWDTEALEDKFMEGLKPEVRKALIYYPNEPKNLEELYERSQRIDREIWGQRDRHGGYGSQQYSTSRYPSRKPMIRKDRDGDIKMIGAKVDMEKARRERLCYSCGKAGHQARFCRNKNKRETATVRMLRSGRTNEQEKAEEEEKFMTELTDRFRSIYTEDPSTDESADEGEKRWPNIEKNSEDEEGNVPLKYEETIEELAERSEAWGRLTKPLAFRHSTVQGYRGGRRPTLQRTRRLRLPSRQLEEEQRHQRIQVKAPVPGDESDVDHLNSANEITNRQGNVEGSVTIEESLAEVDFEKMSETHIPTWRIYGEKREDNKESLRERTLLCTCYEFEPMCWTNSMQEWLTHKETCRQCTEWSERECQIRNHAPHLKDRILQDISKRKYAPGETIKTEYGETCCGKELCMHEFINHLEYDIPWWACYNDDCKDHVESKLLNGTWPKLPLITIRNAQVCPCLRRGCLCSYSDGHPFRSQLTNPRGNEVIVKQLKRKIEELEENLARSKEVSKKIRERVDNIRMARTEGARQLEIKVKVGNKTITAIIDSGADVDYVNEEWSKEMNFPTSRIGKGWIRGYEGTEKRVDILDADVKFRFLGKFQRRKFRVLKKTGEDKMVLGIPWLTEINPDIDWEKRTVRYRQRASKVTEGIEGTPVPRGETSEIEKHISAAEEKKDARKRGGYGGDQTPSPQKKSKEYQEELAAIQEELPDEVKDFADLFCTAE